MMMNDDDFQDTGFSNRDFAVRADVPSKEIINKYVNIIEENLIQACKQTKSQSQGKYEGHLKST